MLVVQRDLKKLEKRSIRNTVKFCRAQNVEKRKLRKTYPYVCQRESKNLGA